MSVSDWININLCNVTDCVNLSTVLITVEN